MIYGASRLAYLRRDMTSIQHNESSGSPPVRIYLWSSLLLTLLAYLPVMNNGFVNWDDPVYIEHNLHIRRLDPASISWMFSNFYAGYWMPLTWLSLSLDFFIGRLEPWVYHLHNLVLHLLNTAVVFLFSFKLLTLVRGPRPKTWTPLAAFGTALLFGLHPLHVESVAWAAERKDLLCGLFSLLSLLAYLSHAVQPRLSWKYAACLGAFLLALLSKPMAVSFPLVFLLLDQWPLERLRPNPAKVLIEKVPFLIAALAAGVIAVMSQSQAGAAWDLGSSPFPFRFTNACHSIFFYLVKMLLPVKLTAFYPILMENTFSPSYLLSVLGALSISLLCFIQRDERPYLAAAWVYYLLTLAPVLGLFQVGNQAAADRFTYLPSLGPFLLAASLLTAFFSKKRWFLLILFTGVAAAFGTMTFRQVTLWRDSTSLWESTLRVHPKNNLVVHNNLAWAYEQEGRYSEALAKYEGTNAMGAPFLFSHWGRARMLAQKGRSDESVQEFKTAMGLNQNFPPLHLGLGRVYIQKKMEAEGLAEIRKAVEMDPHYGEAYNDLGLILRERSRPREAIEAFRKARTLDPDDPAYLRNLIKALEKMGKHQEAMALHRMLSEHPRSLLTMSY